MFSAVPIISYRDHLIKDRKELYRLLQDCQSLRKENGESPIISFCEKISPVDLLDIFERIKSEYPIHFYWENIQEEEGMLGYGVTSSGDFSGQQRFERSQTFIQSCQRRIIKLDRFTGVTPFLFCSFSFFDTPGHGTQPFSAGRIILPRFAAIKKGNDYFFQTNLIVNSGDNLEVISEEVYKNYRLIQYSKNNLVYLPKPATSNYHVYPSYNFQSAVTSALTSIAAGRFSKIVLAHALDVVSPAVFQVGDCLRNLRGRYPDCYTFSISNDKGQHFIGASPERLLSIENQQLITDALAGSAPRGKTPGEDELLAAKLLNNEKERREHQAVSDFITQRLYELGLTPQCSPLKLLKLSNIQHLWTPIYASLKTPLHSLEIVNKLHPTPAVAGVPTEAACEQIRRYESFDRSLYAAPLGWVDCDGNSKFIVGIRSALIYDNQARLYAGAGIVKGSDPVKELGEIQLKFQALFKALV
ncbi:MAG: Salicylate biosynthesis isochorismate synthase [Chroococcopsis gigantea SAG 12.99]|jgi:menaquinone-specific isochorismate synthase|nr:isochorismate synthase [Chlorogloea purpurea SAG 13.99]MDV2999271.1 Salicylate biosynthesis isochorismate synthase [Chroococcopsis gigantea SAG 12.99]